MAKSLIVSINKEVLWVNGGFMVFEGKDQDVFNFSMGLYKVKISIFLISWDIFEDRGKLL